MLVASTLYLNLTFKFSDVHGFNPLLCLSIFLLLEFLNFSSFLEINVLKNYLLKKLF